MLLPVVGSSGSESHTCMDASSSRPPEPSGGSTNTTEGPLMSAGTEVVKAHVSSLPSSFPALSATVAATVIFAQLRSLLDRAEREQRQGLAVTRLLNDAARFAAGDNSATPRLEAAASAGGGYDSNLNLGDQVSAVGAGFAALRASGGTPAALGAP